MRGVAASGGVNPGETWANVRVRVRMPATAAMSHTKRENRRPRLALPEDAVRSPSRVDPWQGERGSQGQGGEVRTWVSSRRKNRAARVNSQWKSTIPPCAGSETASYSHHFVFNYYQQGDALVAIRGWAVGSRTPLVIAVVLVALLATNPSSDDYVAWLKEKIADSAATTGEQQIGKALLELFGGPLVSVATQRNNYFLFSIFVTQLDDQHRLTTVGLLKNFFPLPQGATLDTVAPGAHLIPARPEGHWLPDDGYAWVVNPPVPGDFRVRWEPGRQSVRHIHVVAADAEGRWLPEDGYDWVVTPPPPGDFAVRWNPGRVSRLHPHVVASTAEGRWLPQNGYGWLNHPPIAGDFRVLPN